MIVEPNVDNLKRAAELLRRGELVAFPTETVYGLGGDATNEDAVLNIFRVKGRPAYDPLIVHLGDAGTIEEFADLSSVKVRDRLAALKVLWPGPLSIVLPLKAGHGIAKAVTAGLNTVAVRIPSNPIALELLKLANIPIAAPSANQFSYVSPTRAQHVQDSLGDKVPLILDGGPSKIGIESTVLNITDDDPILLRPGFISKEEIEALIGPVKVIEQSAGKKVRVGDQQENLPPLPSPGMLDKHYSPLTPLFLLQDLSLKDLPPRVGVIGFSKDAIPQSSKIISSKILSDNGALDEIASALYEAIRSLDKLNLDLILIDSCQKSGVGQAIMDRIKRALHKQE